LFVGSILHARAMIINEGYLRKYIMTHEKIDQGPPGAGPLVEPWNLVADGYTAGVLPMMEHFAGEALRLAVLPPSPHIVDVATGPGTLAFLAAKGGATVSAIDFSPAMVANFHRRKKEAGLRFADVRVGDGQELPYNDESFDGAFSIHGLIFFPDRAAGFRELQRVLQAGRFAVVSSMASLSSQFNTVIEIIRSELPDQPIAQGEPPLSDPRAFMNEMSAAGFRQVTIHRVEYSETMPSLSNFWEKVQRAAAGVVLLQHRLGQERWAEVSHSVFERLQKALGNGPVEEIYTAYLGVGVK
jgi:ubiquinone/menaquinone biosynthesis C-methylase UbiE